VVIRPVNLHAERFRSLKIPRDFPRTIPTSPDESDATVQISFESRLIPTSPDGFDHPHASFNPQALGSRPSLPTRSFEALSSLRLTILSAANGEQASI